MKNVQNRRKALIAVNNIGFMWFLMEDIDMLINMGFDVTVAADNSFGEPQTIAEIERRGARFVDVRMNNQPFSKTNLACFRQYRSLMKKERFDAVICHTPITGFLLRAAAVGLKPKGCKVIYMSHGLAWTHLSDAKTRLKFKTMEQLAGFLTDAIITINNDDFVEAGKLNCKRVFLVNGVGCDIDKYRNVTIDRNELRRSIGVIDDKIMILAVGAISVRKNHEVIAEALASMSDKDRYCYVICGRESADDGVGDRLRKIAKDSGIDIRFLGHRNDIDKMVHAADIGVIPSLREGLGMAGIQQLCAGVPMIGTAVQGIKEYIIDGVTGYTVADPRDASGFADAIRKLSDAEVREAMAGDCMSIVGKFALEHSLAQRREIYEEILK